MALEINGFDTFKTFVLFAQQKSNTGRADAAARAILNGKRPHWENHITVPT